MLKSFDGHTPRIAASACISEAAYISGDVEIGENSGVWPGAVLRADLAPIKIGSNTHIEDNSVLHAGTPLEICDNVIVGHGAVVHGSRVGSYTLVGNNATILDGAETGEFCIIAAGCVVPAGMKVPDRSLVTGVPGKIRGEVTAERIEWLKWGVGIYADLARRHKEQGF